MILPDSASTFSLKFITRDASVLTLVAPSPGLDDVIVGLVLSAVVNCNLLLTLSIPTYEFPEASSKAVASIVT